MPRIRGRRCAEFSLRLVDRHIGLEALRLQLRAGRREIACRCNPQRAAVGKLDELLHAGAADGALADEVGTFVPAQRRGKHFGSARRAVVHEQGYRHRDGPITFSAAIFTCPLERDSRIANRARPDEQPCGGHALGEIAAGGISYIDNQPWSRPLWSATQSASGAARLRGG